MGDHSAGRFGRNSDKAAAKSADKGIFYFRRHEFDFFLDQAEYLLGDRHERFFTWFFNGHAPPCDACGHDLYPCACERFERATPPACKLPLEESPAIRADAR